MVKRIYGGGQTFVASHSWMMLFAGRYGLSWRQRTNCKNIDAKARLPRIRLFHARFRRELQLKRKETAKQHHPKWGQYPPQLRFSMDQIPMPFVIDFTTTSASKGDKKVWVREHGNGALSKRQFTLQLCVSPVDGPQPPPALIFRGKGVRISEVEKAAYHKGVHVYWQPKAWADEDFYDD